MKTSSQKTLLIVAVTGAVGALFTTLVITPMIKKVL